MTGPCLPDRAVLKESRINAGTLVVLFAWTAIFVSGFNTFTKSKA